MSAVFTTLTPYEQDKRIFEVAIMNMKGKDRKDGIERYINRYKSLPSFMCVAKKQEGLGRNPNWYSEE